MTTSDDEKRAEEYALTALHEGAAFGEPKDAFADAFLAGLKQGRELALIEHMDRLSNEIAKRPKQNIYVPICGICKEKIEARDEK